MTKQPGPAALRTISEVLGEVARPLELPPGVPESARQKLHPINPAIRKLAGELLAVAGRTGDVRWEDLHRLMLLMALHRLAKATTMAEVAAAERALAIIYNRAPNPTSTRRGSRAPLNPRGPQKHPRVPREEPSDPVEEQEDDVTQDGGKGSDDQDPEVDFELPQG